jgi:hypothetical protein
MIFRSAIRVIVVLAAAVALAQSAQPGTTPGEPILNRQAPTGRRSPVATKTADPQSLAAMREQVENMDSTLSQMRSLLRQMRAKATTSKATDSLTKVNLDMWELMVGHLDKELQHMRLTVAAREEWEARRAALYKQADAKAEAEAQAARASQAARFAQAEKNATGTATPASTGPATGQSAERNSTAQSALAQPSATPATNNSASPK